jgi:hypothetical protein
LIKREQTVLSVSWNERNLQSSCEGFAKKQERKRRPQGTPAIGDFQYPDQYMREQGPGMLKGQKTGTGVAVS